VLARFHIVVLVFFVPVLVSKTYAVTPEVARHAETLIAEGKLSQAETLYLEILAEQPGSLVALSNLGVVYYRQNRILDAIQVLSRAVKLVPTDGFSHRTLGMCYLKADELDLAVKSLDLAIKLNPRDALAHNFMGILATKKNWWETAEKECRRAIELDPDYADAYFNLAVIYSLQKPPRKVLGRKAYRSAIALGAERSAAVEDKLEVEF
jgi:Flp pilus assembly protein TadD